MFRSFFSTIFRGSSTVFCAVAIPPADLRSLSSYYYAVCGAACVCRVCVWCSCLLVICLCLCTSTLLPADLRSLSSYHYAACGRMCTSSVCVWCSCLLVICLCTSRSPTDKNTKHAQMTYTCGHILHNNTNSTNSYQREE